MEMLWTTVSPDETDNLVIGAEEISSSGNSLIAGSVKAKRILDLSEELGVSLDESI